MLSELQVKADQGKESPNSLKFLTWNLTTLRCFFYVFVRKRLTEENSKQASQARPAYLCSVNPTSQSSVTENYSCQSHLQGGWYGFSLSLASPFFSFYASHSFSTTTGSVLAELCIGITLFSKGDALLCASQTEVGPSPGIGNRKTRKLTSVFSNFTTIEKVTGQTLSPGPHLDQTSLTRPQQLWAFMSFLAKSNFSKNTDGSV